MFRFCKQNSIKIGNIVWMHQMGKYEFNFNLVVTSALAGLYAITYPTGVAFRGLYSSAFKAVMSVPRFYFEIKTQYDEHGNFEKIVWDNKVWVGKVLSTFALQSVKFFTVQGVQSLLIDSQLVDDLLHAGIHAEAIVGCAVMYPLRYLGDLSRDIDKFDLAISQGAPLKTPERPALTLSQIVLVGSKGIVIGYAGRFVKGTPFSKLPNMIYEVEGYFGVNFGIKFLKLLLDGFTYGTFSYSEMKVKEYTQDVQAAVDKYANATKEYYYPSSSYDQWGLNEFNFTSIPYGSGKRISRIEYQLSEQLLSRCEYLKTVYIGNTTQSITDKHNIIFSIEQIWDVLDSLMTPKALDALTSLITPTACYYPCIKSESCQSVVKIYNYDSFVSQFGVDEMNSACPEVMELVGQHIINLLSDCWNQDA